MPVNILAPGSSEAAIKAALATLKPSFRGAAIKRASTSGSTDASPDIAFAADTDVYDTSSLHDTVTNNSRITIPAGVTRVQLKFQVEMGTITVGSGIAIYFLKNGALVLGRGFSYSYVNSTTWCLQTTTAVLDVVAGDYFQGFLFDGGDSSITINATRSWLTCEVIK